MRCVQDASSDAVETLDICLELGTVGVGHGGVAVAVRVGGELGVEGDVVGEGGQLAGRPGGRRRAVEEVHEVWLGVRRLGGRGGGRRGRAARRGGAVRVAGAGRGQGLLLEIEHGVLALGPRLLVTPVLVLPRPRPRRAEVGGVAAAGPEHGVRSLGLEVELDGHLLHGRPRLLLLVVMLLLLLLMVVVVVLMFLVPQSVLVLRLCPEGPGLDGDHAGGVGVYEAGQRVAGRGGGPRPGRLLGAPGLAGVARARGAAAVGDRVCDELSVELLKQSF